MLPPVDALADLNPWWREKTVPVELVGRPRAVARRLLADLHRPEVTILTGIRRAGKSTLLYQMANLLVGGGTDPRHVLYANLEDVALDDVGLEEIDRAHSQLAGGAPMRYLLLDEIQSRPGWERWVRTRIDRKEPVRIAVTGSSAALVHGEYAALLTGRHLTTTIAPLDFEEYLEFHGAPATRIPEPPLPLPRRKEDELIHRLDDYLEHGGFPEPNRVGPALARRLLQHYFNDMLFRDLAQREARGVERFRRLAAYLAETIARPHSVTSLHRATGLARDTVYEHLDALERIFLIHRARRFTWSPKPTAVAQSPFKVYLADTGLRNAVSSPATRDRGRLAENLVAVTLQARDAPLTYWTDGRDEVDFVVARPGGKIDAYQVTYGTTVPPREERGLQALRDELPKRQHGRFVVLTRMTQEARDGIELVPLWRWLLPRARDAHDGGPAA